jgi:hypothetical protein
MNEAFRLGKVVMTHVRDVRVCHTITDKVFISVPLYFEKGMVFQNARISCNELIIEGRLKPKEKDDREPLEKLS